MTLLPDILPLARSGASTSFLMRYRLIVLLVGGLIALAPASVRAAQTDASQAPASAGGGTSAVTSRQAQQVLDMLNDPQKRAAFSQTLDAIVKQQGGSAPVAAPAAPAATPAPAPAPTASNAVVTAKSKALGSDLRDEIASLQGRVGQQFDQFVSLFRDLGAVSTWVRQEIRHARASAVLLNALMIAAAVFVVALILERVCALVLRRPLAALTRHSVASHLRQRQRGATPDAPGADSDAAVAEPMATEAEKVDARQSRDVQQGREAAHFLRRVPYALVHLALKLVPVLVCLGVGNVGVALLARSSEGESVGLTTINAYIMARCVFLLIETLFAPTAPSLRLWLVSTMLARKIVRWWTVLVAAPALVLWLTVIGTSFGMAPRGIEALIRMVVLVEHLLLAAFIWNIRKNVTQALTPTQERQEQPFWAFMAFLARYWWIGAIFIDIALWAVWATQNRGGYRWLWQTTGLTVLVLGISRLLSIGLFNLQARLFQLGHEEKTLAASAHHSRLNRYYPLARRTTNGLVVFVTIVLLLQVWGMHSLVFLSTNPVGTHLVSAVLTVIAAVIVGIIAWEIANSALDRRVAHYDSSEAVSRAVRLRTVLPIIRTVLAVFIIIIVTVTAMSQVGINVAPLLTGAGILGAAIAFGSQSLVKDFITGFFMLVENAVQVGDVVNAAGVTGTVEHLSIRTLRLRTGSGELYIIPFSSVTSVSNQSRDYNNVTVSLTLDLSQDPAPVVELLSSTVAEMRADPNFARMIVSDFNYLGVDMASNNGTILTGTVKTAPGSMWPVQRELHKRMRPRYLENGIHFPGWAPPISRLVTEQPIQIQMSGTQPVPAPAPQEPPTDASPEPSAS